MAKPRIEKEELGFILPDGKTHAKSRIPLSTVIPAGMRIKDEDMYVFHANLAKELGFKDERDAVIKGGLVRYVHGPKEIILTLHSGHKHAMENASDFISQHGMNKKIYLDLHHDESGQKFMSLNSMGGSGHGHIFAALRGGSIPKMTDIARIRALPDLPPRHESMETLDEVIRKTGESEWTVFSHKGRRLGSYKSIKAAKERLRQIEYFKHVKEERETPVTKHDMQVAISKMKPHLRGFSMNQVRQGFEDEKEHDKPGFEDVIKGKPAGRAEHLLKIVLAHLKEKPDYYTRLKKAMK